VLAIAADCLIISFFGAVLCNQPVRKPPRLFPGCFGVVLPPLTAPPCQNSDFGSGRLWFQPVLGDAVSVSASLSLGCCCCSLLDSELAAARLRSDWLYRRLLLAVTTKALTRKEQSSMYNPDCILMVRALLKVGLSNSKD
jgi:hypothetical protein